MAIKTFTFVDQAIDLMEEAPLVFVVILRQRKVDLIELGCFLIDTGCLGVKDAWYDTHEADFDAIKAHYFTEGSYEKTAAWGRHFVESSVAYAKALGFKPPRDFKKAARLFGGIQARDCEETFTFGRKGKPFYVQGTNDSHETAQKVIRQLRRKCGDDGFDFILEMSDEDDDLETQVDGYLDLAQTGKNDEARVGMKQLLREYPDSELVIYGCGVLCVLDDDLDVAVRYFKKALEIDPTFGACWYNLAIAHKQSARVVDMLAALRQATRHGSSEDGYWQPAQGILFSMAESVTEDYGISLDDYITSGIKFFAGIELMEDGDFEPALECFRHAAEWNPRSEPTFGNIGVCLIQLGRISEARIALQNALELRPDYEPALKNLELIKDTPEGVGRPAGDIKIGNYAK